MQEGEKGRELSAQLFSSFNFVFYVIFFNFFFKKNFHSPLSLQCNHRPRRPRLVHLLVDLRLEANPAHDAVAKPLIQDRLVRVAVVLHHLVEPVDERLRRRHGHRGPAVGKSRHLLAQLPGVDAQEGAELVDILGRGARLAVEEGGAGHFAAAEVGGDVCKGEVLGGFGLEEEGAEDGEVDVFGGLRAATCVV